MSDVSEPNEAQAVPTDDESVEPSRETADVIAHIEDQEAEARPIWCALNA